MKNDSQILQMKRLFTAALLAFAVSVLDVWAQDEILNKVKSDMVFVEGGTFMMGATGEQGDDAESMEKPAHQVTLSPYYISKYVVTQEVWEHVMGSNPSQWKDDKEWPVNNVNWEDCQEFIRKLNTLTGASFRLPTEAEWEYAVRGGNKSRGYKYAGSDNLDEVGWYKENNTASFLYKVGRKAPNELGLYDMSGLVFEWCNDWLMAHYPEEPQTDPQGPSEGDYGGQKVFRGGALTLDAPFCRVSYRGYGQPSTKHFTLGLRLAADNTGNALVKGEWYLVTDTEEYFQMSNVGMLVGIDESPYLSVLDILGNILAEDVLKVHFVRKEVTAIENIQTDKPKDILKEYVNNTLTLIAASGEIKIYSVSGAMVASAQALGKETVIDVSSLPKGPYILKCGKQSFKFNKR